MIAYEEAHGNPFDWNLKEVSEALGSELRAGVKVKAVLKTDGFNAGVRVLVQGEVHDHARGEPSNWVEEAISRSQT